MITAVSSHVCVSLVLGQNIWYTWHVRKLLEDGLINSSNKHLTAMLIFCLFGPVTFRANMKMLTLFCKLVWKINAKYMSYTPPTPNSMIMGLRNLQERTTQSPWHNSKNPQGLQYEKVLKKKMQYEKGYVQHVKLCNGKCCYCQENTARHACLYSF